MYDFWGFTIEISMWTPNTSLYLRNRSGSSTLFQVSKMCLSPWFGFTRLRLRTFSTKFLNCRNNIILLKLKQKLISAEKKYIINKKNYINKKKKKYQHRKKNINFHLIEKFESFIEKNN